ncbi:MAG: GMP/IMP nucleotidase [Panacagrimonas sp.]
MSASPIDWSRVDHVLLDMDGTILDLAFDNYFWGELVPQRYAESKGLTLDQAYQVLMPRFEAVRQTLPWYCTDYWSEQTGLCMASLKHEVRDRIRLLDGSLEFLQAARAAGKQVWLATNAHPDSWRLKLDHTGIDAHFDGIISSHDFGAPKEDDHFWQAVFQMHRFDPARSLFADDNEQVLLAARRFGIGQIIGMHHPDSGAEARSFSDFDSVARLNELLPIP